MGSSFSKFIVKSMDGEGRRLERGEERRVRGEERKGEARGNERGQGKRK